MAAELSDICIIKHEKEKRQMLQNSKNQVKLQLWGQKLSNKRKNKPAT